MASISEPGLAFIERHEGRVLRAYRDPVGIWTIGVGFTNRSPAVTRMLGKIGAGLRITHEQCTRVLREVIAAEFWPATEKGLPGGRSFEQDAGCSVAFNCGPGAFAWKWAQAWRQGNKVLAAQLLQTTAVTAAGKRLPGLVRRRQEESALLLAGNYGASSITGQRGRVKIVPGMTRTLTAEELDYISEWSDKLARLGFDWPKGLGVPAGFVAAVRAFQAGHPHLTQDGICGPATEAQITRALDARAKATKTAAGGVAGGAVAEGAAQTGIDPTAALSPGMGLTVGGIILAVGLGALAWQYRGEIQHWFNKVRGRTVE